MFLVQLFAVVYVGVGLGFLVNTKYFASGLEDALKNKAFVLYGGIAALVAGFAIVSFHNVWVWDWPVIATVIGWLALVKGALLLLVPGFVLGVAKSFLKPMKFIGFVALVLGLLLGYVGWYLM